jgi:excisionase family DNA binding protein
MARKQRISAEFDFKYYQFTVTETAHHLRISRAFLYKLIAAGRIRPVKLGARTLISGAEIERLMNASASERV